MRIDELILEKNKIKYQIKSLNSRLEELNKSYLPSQNTEVQVFSKSNNSPQEILLIQSEVILEKIKKLIIRQSEIDELIDKELDAIENPIYKWIVSERLMGKSWKEMEFGYSQSYMRRIFAETMASLRKEEEKRK